MRSRERRRAIKGGKSGFPGKGSHFNANKLGGKVGSGGERDHGREEGVFGDNKYTTAIGIPISTKDRVVGNRWSEQYFISDRIGKPGLAN